MCGDSSKPKPGSSSSSDSDTSKAGGDADPLEDIRFFGEEDAEAASPALKKRSESAKTKKNAESAVSDGDQMLPAAKPRLSKGRRQGRGRGRGRGKTVDSESAGADERKSESGAPPVMKRARRNGPAAPPALTFA